MSHLQSVLLKHVPDTHKPPQIHPAHQTPHATTSKILQLTHSHHIITPHDPPFNLPNLYPLHLARNSQHPQLKNTYPTPRQHPKTKHCHHLKNHSSHPTIYTSPSFCSTSFTSNRLHSLTPPRKPLLPSASPPTPYPPFTCPKYLLLAHLKPPPSPLTLP